MRPLLNDPCTNPLLSNDTSTSLTVAGDALAREAPAAARELAVAVASLATFGAVVAALALAARRPPLPA